MEFEIDFNETGYYNDDFLINKLGGYLVPTGSDKYPPFEIVKINIKDFEHLKEILDMVNKELGGYYSAVISFDSPTIYLDKNI